MSMHKITLKEKILPGSISVVHSQCGKENCACKLDPPKLHGPYYRWTGTIRGKRTTRTISKEIAQVCQRRIKSFRALQKQLQLLIDRAVDTAPWEQEDE